MLRRALILTIPLALAVQCASSGQQTAPQPAAKQPERSLLLRPFHALIDDHRQRGTHMDGPRCPMYPSCAAYAENIMRERGVLGFLLSIDRLFYREFGKLDSRYFLTPARLSQSPRYYDPVQDALPEDRPSFFKEELGR